MFKKSLSYKEPPCDKIFAEWSMTCEWLRIASREDYWILCIEVHVDTLRITGYSLKKDASINQREIAWNFIYCCCEGRKIKKKIYFWRKKLQMSERIKKILCSKEIITDNVHWKINSRIRSRVRLSRRRI